MIVKIKKLTVLLVGILCGVLAMGSLSFAAHTPKPVQATAPATVKTTIFDYQKEVGLSDKQADAIRQKIGELQRTVRKINAELTLLNLDIQDLNAKNGNFNQLKKKVKAAYALVADLKIADYKTTRDINAVMSAKQLKKWRGIQKENIREARKARKKAKK